MQKFWYISAKINVKKLMNTEKILNEIFSTGIFKNSKRTTKKDVHQQIALAEINANVMFNSVFSYSFVFELIIS